MSIEAYRYFLSVARAGNFRKASDELFISQPAISYQIKKLEESLGYSLFDRSPKSTVLTPEGKILYLALLECEKILDRAQSDISSQRTKASLCGQLRIGILNSWDIRKFGKPFFTNFFVKNDVELYLARLGSAELTEQLERNELDLIALPFDQLESSMKFNYFSLGRFPLYLIIAKTHPLADSVDILERLDEIKLYTHQPEREIPIKRLAGVGVHSEIELVPNIDSKIAAVENGMGYTFVLSCSGVRSLPQFNAYRYDAFQKEIVLAYKKNRDPLISAFLDDVKALQGED